jgi:hypothetical protein
MRDERSEGVGIALDKLLQADAVLEGMRNGVRPAYEVDALPEHQVAELIDVVRQLAGDAGGLFRRSRCEREPELTLASD